MTRFAEPQTLDGWSWPPGVPPPVALAETRAGAATIRYPDARAGTADTLLDALRAGSRALAAVPVREVAAALGAAAVRMTERLDDNLAAVAANAGLSPESTRAALAGMADSWTPSALAKLVREEFPAPEALDGFVPSGSRSIRAAGHPLALHLGSGSVPGVTATSLIRALLVKSAVLVKPGAGDVALTVRFAKLARAAHPALASAIAVQYWPGGHRDWDGWERAMFREVGQVVVYGSDEAIESVRARTPARTNLVEHPHRIGVAIVDPARASASAETAAKAVALFDQRGCVNPQLFFLLAAPAEATRWCGELAGELEKLSRTLPPAAPTSGEASAVHQTRGRLALKAAAGEAVRLWSPAHGESLSRTGPPAHVGAPAPAEPPEALGWTVALARVEDFVPGGARTAWVVPASGPEACLAGLATLLDVLPTAGVLQTVGVAGPSLGDAFAEALFDLGVARMVPLDRMPFPEAEWLHDGRRPLGELVRWGERREDA